MASRKPAMKYGPGRNWNLYTLSTSFCSVVGCSSCTKSCPTLWFFKLPSHTKLGPRRTQWLAKIGQTGTKYFHCLLVCELHFKPTDFIKTSKGKKLCSNAIPSLCLPTEYQSPGKPKHVYQRINNLVKKSCDPRNVTCIVEQSTTAHEASEINCNNVNINALGSNSKEKLSINHSACNTMALIKSQKLTDHPHNTREEYSDELKIRMFKLYYSNAQAYEVLQNILGLPPVSSLQSFIPPTPTAVNAIYMENLNAQVSHMSANQKYCILCLTLTRIKPFVGYDYSSDSATGVCGRISVVPVQYAVIAMARGIIFSWQYMASITLIGSLDMCKEYNIWLDNLLHAMVRIGYDVKAILTGTDYFFVQTLALKKSTINNSAYFKNNIQKVCHIFDPLHLMLLLYEELEKSNTFTFTEQGKKKLGNWKYITKFYELDSKRTFRLTNKTSVVNPDDWQQNKLKSVAQILSMSTATGISIFMELNIFNDKARDTLDFIVRINKIFAALYPDVIQPEYKYTQEGNFWRDSIQFLQSIEVPSMDHSIETECQFIKYFCTSIQSIIFMQADIFLKDHALTLTQNLNQDPLMDFIHKINLTGFKHKYPDLKEFFEVIAGDLMNNTFKPEINGANTDNFIEKAKNLKEKCSKTVDLRKKITKRDYDENYENSYTQIKNCDADSLFYVATYLIDKMCQKYRNSVTSRLTLMNSSVYYIKKNSLSFSGSIIVPDNDFLQLVYNMDAVFVNNCKRAMTSGCWHEELMKQMSESIVAVPIDIASLKYITSLFVDLRIYHSIKYNNEVYEKGYTEGQQFVLRRLNSKGLNFRQIN